MNKLLFLLVLLNLGCGGNTTDTHFGGSDKDTNEVDVVDTTSTDSSSQPETTTELDSAYQLDSSSGGQVVDLEDSDSSSEGAADVVKDPTSITVQFIAGSANDPKIIYAMWLENKERSFVQNLYICNRLIDNSLTGIALPYWSMNKYENSQLDGLSGATITSPVSVARDIEPEATKQFTAFVEIDHSWDDNDWFEDQPALLYAVDVNLESSIREYTFTPVGWTAASQNKITNIDGAPSLVPGELNTEMRYITHGAQNGGFGAADGRSSTNMVAELKLVLN